MAYQPGGGGGGGGSSGGGVVPDLNLPLPETGGVIPDLNLPLPETGEEGPPPAAEADHVSSPPEKRMRRVDDDQGGQRKVVAEAAVFPILELPDDLLWRILTHLPLRDAIRSGVLAQGWRDIWKSRWSDPPSCLDIHILPDDKPTEVLRALERHPRRRPLDRFSLVVDNQMFRNQHLGRFLAYAARRHVQDLQIDLRRCKPTEKFTFHLPRSSPFLAHLSLRNINISNHFYNKPQTPIFSALEVIRLHSVTSTVRFGNVVALCPRLRVLEMRRCYCGHILTVMRGAADILPPSMLIRVVIAERYVEIRLHTVGVVEPSRLRSFRYSGKTFPYHFPAGAAPTDLYICLGEPIPYAWGTHRFLPDDLSGLTVLTVCSNALKVVSSLLYDGPSCIWAKVNKFPNLKELQLLMLGTEMDILADLYLLIKSCGFSKLERLFVQLPATSDVPLRDSVEDVSVELPGDSLVKLGMVKVMNFNWRRFEVQLVSLLLSKATSLHKLLLVSPNVAPLHVPGVQEADLLLLEEALASGRIIVRESDDPATQPFHPEVFIEDDEE